MEEAERAAQAKLRAWVEAETAAAARTQLEEAAAAKAKAEREAQLIAAKQAERAHWEAEAAKAAEILAEATRKAGEAEAAQACSSAATRPFDGRVGTVESHRQGAQRRGDVPTTNVCARAPPGLLARDSWPRRQRIQVAKERPRGRRAAAFGPPALGASPARRRVCDAASELLGDLAATTDLADRRDVSTGTWTCVCVTVIGV